MFVLSFHVAPYFQLKELLFLFKVCKRYHLIYHDPSIRIMYWSIAADLVHVFSLTDSCSRKEI